MTQEEIEEVEQTAKSAPALFLLFAPFYFLSLFILQYQLLVVLKFVFFTVLHQQIKKRSDLTLSSLSQLSMLNRIKNLKVCETWREIRDFSVIQ